MTLERTLRCGRVSSPGKSRGTEWSAYRLVTLLHSGLALLLASGDLEWWPPTPPRQWGCSLSSENLIQGQPVCVLCICTMHNVTIKYCSWKKCSKQWLHLLLNFNIYVSFKLTCYSTYVLINTIFYMEVNLEKSQSHSCSNTGLF